MEKKNKPIFVILGGIIILGVLAFMFSRLINGSESQFNLEMQAQYLGEVIRFYDPADPECVAEFAIHGVNAYTFWPIPYSEVTLTGPLVFVEPPESTLIQHEVRNRSDVIMTVGDDVHSLIWDRDNLPAIKCRFEIYNGLEKPLENSSFHHNVVIRINSINPPPLD